MATDDRTGERDLTETEVEALHEVELGVEWLHRAHGELVAMYETEGAFLQEGYSE